MVCKYAGEPFDSADGDTYGDRIDSIDDLDPVESELRAAELVAKAKDTPRSSIWTISTDHRDRHRDVINVGGWDLKHFRQSPVVLWAHKSGEAPIGRVTEIWKDAKGKTNRLRAIKQFTDIDENEFGHMIWRLTEGGYVRAASVGFKSIKSEVDPEDDRGILFKRQELLESSIVPIPANPFALTDARKSMDLSAYVPWCEKMLDEAHEHIGMRRDMIEKVYAIVRGDPASVVVPPDAPAADEIDLIDYILSDSDTGIDEEDDQLPSEDFELPDVTLEQMKEALRESLPTAQAEA